MRPIWIWAFTGFDLGIENWRPQSVVEVQPRQSQTPEGVALALPFEGAQTLGQPFLPPPLNVPETVSISTRVVQELLNLFNNQARKFSQPEARIIQVEMDMVVVQANIALILGHYYSHVGIMEGEVRDPYQALLQ